MLKLISLAGLLFCVNVPCFAYEQVITEIDQVSYSNDGAYQAAVVITWENRKSGEIYSARYPVVAITNSHDKDGWLVSGKKQTVKLDQLSGPGRSDLHEGDEVWAVITIAQGDAEDCQKERYKFIYKSGANARAKYITRGTSLNDNRCRLINKPK
ncbi:MAG: hypothetical protein L3J24_07865 [Xanthomonadales bacterium]|nr:hypothetical protein [Xanthomonadales bacterium]